MLILPSSQLSAFVAFGALWWSVCGASARADDYRPDGTDWNGLSELISLAAAEDIPLRAVDDVDLGRTSPTTGLLVVYPATPLPKRDIARLLRAGMRIAVADDFGAGAELFRHFGIDRHFPSHQNVLRFRTKPELLVARPRYRHALTEGVSSLVTNHPTVVQHPALEPLAGFGDASQGVVLTGAVGNGRLVAISDPSMFINNMLQFSGNRRFAVNLLRYLAVDREEGVLLATPSTRFSGDGLSGDRAQRKLALNDWIAKVSRVDTPPAALWIGATVITAIFLVFATTALPLRSPYRAESMWLRPRGPRRKKRRVGPDFYRAVRRGASILVGAGRGEAQRNAGTRARRDRSPPP